MFILTYFRNCLKRRAGAADSLALVLALVPAGFCAVDFAGEEHKVLNDEFEAQLDGNRTLFEGNVATLAERYGGALVRLRTELEKRRVQFAVDLVQSEIDRLAAGDYGGFPEETVLPDKVRVLREAFEEFYDKNEREAGNLDARALFRYDMGMKELAAQFAAAGDVASMEKLQAYREDLLNPKPEPEPEPEPEVVRPPGDPEVVRPNPKPPVRVVRRPPKRTRPTISRETLDSFAMTMPQPMSSSEISAAAAQLGPRPEAAADGSYAVCLASMRSGQVTEIKPSLITRWGRVSAEKMYGKAYWTIPVTYKAMTIFGEMNAEGKALIQGGKVTRWIYAASLEEIP